MGSGSVGVAAARLGRRFMGTDLNLEAVRLSAERLRQFGAGREPTELAAGHPLRLLELMGTQR
jgi:site-specific DNA-methyltransferase (adenine-specific)